MDTKERIIQAANELFYKHGVKRITMDDIAQHLSVSKKTIYGFFSDKDEIVHTVCAMNLDNNKCEFESLSENARDSVHEIIECMNHVSAMFSVINPNLFYDLQKYYPKSWEMFRKFREENMMNLFEKNLKAGIKDGLYRDDINIKILARLRVEQIVMAMNPDVFPPHKYNHREVQLELLDHFLHGIVTVKGNKLISKYKNIIAFETEKKFAAYYHN